MQKQIKSKAPVTAVKSPILVLDTNVLNQVSGGAGPHGGWAVEPEASVGTTLVGRDSRTCPDASGPHGGWRLPS